MNKGTNNPCCCVFSLIGALLAAVGIAGVFYAGLIVAIIPLVYVTLVLGILVLLYAFITAFCGGRHQCAALDSCLISTAVGSIVTSAFALAATTLPAASLTVGILIAAVAFFLISNLFNIINLIIGKLCRGCCKEA